MSFQNVFVNFQHYPNKPVRHPVCVWSCCHSKKCYHFNFSSYHRKCHKSPSASSWIFATSGGHSQQPEAAPHYLGKRVGFLHFCQVLAMLPASHPGGAPDLHIGWVWLEQNSFPLPLWRLDLALYVHFCAPVQRTPRKVQTCFMHMYNPSRLLQETFRIWKSLLHSYNTL